MYVHISYYKWATTFPRRAQNLREVSVHLMRECGGGGGGGGGRGVESGVHAVATRWAAAQLDASRALCRSLARPLAATPQHNQQRGFSFMYGPFALYTTRFIVTVLPFSLYFLLVVLPGFSFLSSDFGLARWCFTLNACWFSFNTLC